MPPTIAILGAGPAGLALALKLRQRPDPPRGVVIEEGPEATRHTSEILERVEIMTREEPVNIALIIKQWLGETSAGKHR